MTTGVLTTSFPRFSGDFAGCFVEDQVHASVARGEKIEVIAAGPSLGAGARDRSSDTASEFRDERPDLAPAVRVFRIRMPGAPRGPSLFYGAGAPETLEAAAASAWLQGAVFWAHLCEQIRLRAPTWQRIVAHWLVPSALAAHAVAPQLPLTAYAHSGDIALLERIPGGRALARLLSRVCSDLVFASANLRRRFAAMAGQTIGRVAAVPDVARVISGSPASSAIRDGSARAEARLVLGMRDRTILAVGRLVPIKGFDLLLRAVALSRKYHQSEALSPCTAVCILGDGPERPHLEQLARRLRVPLQLPGFVSRTEVARWMMGADIYLQPSRCLANGRTEGLPTATLEALAAGIPVIASRSGGLSELACQGLRLVAANDVAALAEALLTPGPSGQVRRGRAKACSWGDR